MTLTEDDVRRLARASVDFLATDVDLDIEPDSRGEPGWVVWPLCDRERSFGVFVGRAMTAAEAVEGLLESMNEYVADSERFWGQAFPACPGHVHYTGIEVTDTEQGAVVVLTCPSSGQIVSRTAVTR